jgi:DNA-binding response OmpR family regulator
MSENRDEMHREQIRVLIVDDEPSICRALSIALARAGFTVSVAHSGDSALATLTTERVDVMVIDLRMPDTRGDVVFELAAATHPHLRRQTLFMTGDITEKAHKLILSCKCPSIRKPFDLRDLIANVESLVPHLGRAAQDQSA